ncbi:HAMP domain-containing protein [Oscillatoriales cyanobacterium LEGE 11467]|uniref:histidine kinase n=1 Tax=Zarconia navalis LEGE 11467 TaxID=1828826 RepID=A0A928VZU3_9CYAN|nr:ATP-binding protein [Zarconia navalis]MBE9041356.1 HAMP domain-containing protein [Zarconia navalis LEGE 11467]
MKFISKRGLFWEARASILAWYVLLMGFLLGLSMPIASQLVFAQVNARVREDLESEIQDFKRLKASRNIKQREDVSDRELEKLFADFLYQQLPEDDTFLIAISNRTFYRSSPAALPEVIQKDSALIQRLATTTTSQSGVQKTEDLQIGNVLYRAEPVRTGSQIRGVLIVAHTTAGEREEALASNVIFVKVLATVSFFALILAWFAAGKVLAPVRWLTNAARSIGETDLSRRIPVRGSGEMMELAMTFNAMMDRLQNAFASQRSFINDASHELRTPITIIQGHLELLGDDPIEREETVELVLDELDRMGRLVEDLILLAKAERHDFLQRENVDVACLSEELFAKVRGLATRNWTLEQVARCHIRADRQRLTQAVLNLAQNATHYTQESDTIALGSRLDRDEIRFWVCDTGEGISEDDRTRIFERFARAARGRRRSEGAGLGLSIVRAIALAHGGRVELQSQLGVGSTFTLVLPLETPSALG